MASEAPSNPRPQQLARPPLAEAVVEIRWKLAPATPSQSAGASVDPGYPLSVGLLLERIKERFPVVEELPVTAVPDQLTPHVVRHRFRATPDGWPCVQLGPGVATVNFVSEYTWQAFRDTVLYFAPLLTNAYETAGHPIEPTSVVLRYVNSVPFVAARDDLIDYIGANLNVALRLPKAIAESEVREGPPEGFVLRVGLPLRRPAGVGYVQIGNGTHENAPALVWDLSVASTGERAPRMDATFAQWLNEAHELIEDWFFALIENKLEREFGEVR